MSIFRSRETNTGFTNFDNCQNKTVEYTDFVSELSYSSIVEATSDLNKETRSHRGSSAELHCPRTADDRVTVEVPYKDGQRRGLALSILKREAGSQVCKACVYAPMSPLEATQYDANIAKSELEKVELLRARAEAIAELAAVDPAYRHMS